MNKAKSTVAANDDVTFGAVRHWWIHVVALAVFALTTLLFFAPAILENKIIQQSDIIHFKGMSREIVEFRKLHQKDPLWTNTMFSGMPAFQISVEYKGNLLRFIDTLLSFGFPHPARLMFMASLCFYLLLLTLRTNPWVALAGALAYGLSTYNLTLLEAGHNSKLHSIALMPLVVAGILMVRRGQWWWGGLFTAAALSLLIKANHLQITYYLMLTMIVYGISEAVFALRDRQLRPLLVSAGILILAAAFAFFSNLSLLWSTYEYLPSTIRGPSELSSNQQSTGGLDKDYAFAWSYGKLETFTLLIPGFKGSSSHARLAEDSHFAEFLSERGIMGRQKQQYLSAVPLYWGDQPFTSGPFYLGAAVCFLFVLALLLLDNRWRWWLLVASALAIMLSWGRHFMWFSDLFFYHVPGYNKFRTVSMILVVTQLLFPLGAMLVVSQLLQHRWAVDVVKKKLLWATVVVGGLALFMALIGPSLFSFSGGTDKTYADNEALLAALKADRKSMLRADAFRSLFFILIIASALWFYIKGSMSRGLLLGLLIMVMFADLFPVGRRYLNNEDFVSSTEYNRPFQPSEADRQIMAQKGVFRVFNLASDPWNDSRTSYFHFSIGGYHAAKLRRYQELIEQQLSQRTNVDASGYPFNKKVVDMLNARYFIVPASADDRDNTRALENPDALGNAWFVDSVQWVANADAEMASLNAFDPAKVALVDERFRHQLTNTHFPKDTTAYIRLTHYQPNHLIYESNNRDTGLAVFSEVYYQPGWNAYVDGQPQPHFRCNYILRAMIIPAGKHQIEFRFEPRSFYLGEKIAMATSAVWLLLAAGGALWYLRRMRNRYV
ncbi:MAG: YfhO family protein [Chitinophagales bacterium]|nr:YfhO family protein [Chitinophagales bacterium]MDW8427469.1 YfhO family protein [Chitinophagales bacterium]